MSGGNWLLLLLVLVGALTVGGAAWALLRWRRAKLQKRVKRVAPRLRYPVVLAHGIMGFDQLKIGKLQNDYFRGVPARLTKLGAKVYAFQVQPSASITERAQQLARLVQQLDAEKVNIIAHSMGGLDARYAISRLQLAAKVASLTTIATPHRGTPIADFGTGLFGQGEAVRKLLLPLGLQVDGFFDLTTTRMASFNAQVPDVRGVLYASYVARANGTLRGMNPLLIPTHRFLLGRGGENDGMVPASSQSWGEVLGTLEADHWAQIGWSTSFDAPAFYEQVIEELKRRGV